MMQADQAKPIRPIQILSRCDADFRDLKPWLEREWIPLTVFEDLEALLEAAIDDAVFVLDLEALETSLAEAIERLQSCIGTFPDFLCILKENHIDHRLEAVRAGARACLFRPWLPEELARLLIERAVVDRMSPQRVLLLQQNPQDTQALLQSAGIEPLVLKDLRKLFHSLYDFQPDLLILDEQFPEVNGLEITALVRTHEDFFSLPILLLAAQDTQIPAHQAKEAGVDAFFPPEKDARDLLATVRQYIRHVRSFYSRLGGRPEYCKTGLHNYRYFLRQLEHALKEPAPRMIGLIYFRVSPLVPKAEQSAILAQEVFLREVGHRIRKHLYPADLAAQVNARDFVLLGHREETAGFIRWSEQLYQAFSEQVLQVADQPLRIAAHFGVLVPDREAEEAESLINRARHLCIQAGQEGKTPPIKVNAALRDGRDAREQAILRLLRETLKKNAFRLLFQPIAATGEQHQEHYDTLLRIRIKNGKTLRPDFFLPVAKKHGLMAQIDRWVLSKALQVLAARSSRSAPTRLIVRQTLETLQAEDWLSWLQQQLAARELGQNKPILEFQLDDLLQHLPVAKVRFQSLKQQGIDICIGRYKDQPAARTLLTELPIAFIKPDTSLLPPAGENKDPRLDRLILHAHNNGVQVIAGQLEAFEAVTQAWQSKVDYVLGYFLQPPLESLDFDFTESRY